MEKQSTGLDKFLLYFGELYHQLRKASSKVPETVDSHVLKYKIGNSYEDYQKTGKILIQARKGSAYLYLTPQKICEDENIIGHLHPIDASIITKLRVETDSIKISEPKYYIRKQLSSEEGIIFEIADRATEETFLLKQMDIVSQPDLINNLSGKDAMSVGMAYGESYAQKISSLKQKK